jgi:hypothetical protein
MKKLLNFLAVLVSAALGFLSILPLTGFFKFIDGLVVRDLNASWAAILIQVLALLVAAALSAVFSRLITKHMK